MSFILDALKKSETERQQQGPSDFANVPSSTDSPRAPRWLWALGLLLAVNLAVLLGVLLRDDAPEIIPQSGQTSLAQPEPAAGASFETPVEAPASVPPPATPPRSPPQTGFTLAALPTADELRANGTIQIADLHLDIHVYSEQPDDRFVFINMVRHREKSRLAEGPVVQEITPEGVILDYAGTRFLLPRE
jgi:general secretion pathway protein B